MAGNFHRVECAACGNEQIVFEKAATEVECAECEEVLVTPTGGFADIAGEIVETVEAR